VDVKPPIPRLLFVGVWTKPRGAADLHVWVSFHVIQLSGNITSGHILPRS
jgi:hypothetical protein